MPYAIIICEQRAIIDIGYREKTTAALELAITGTINSLSKTSDTLPRSDNVYDLCTHLRDREQEILAQEDRTPSLAAET